MKKIIKLFCLVIASCMLNFQSQAQVTEQRDRDLSDQQQSQKTEWFRDAKFGIFIHWGLFAQSGGEWEGKRYFGISEWLMNRAKIPVTKYEKLATEFNPIKFNAQSWVDVAKKAGAKYIVVTAKHHEGFAMFDSKVSDYNIMNTPFHRDPMKELSKACQRDGVKLGFYYSQFLDWHEPNGGGNDWDFVESKKDYQAYYKSKSIPQIKELLSNYGPLGLIWFDMPGGLSKSETESLISQARNLQPDCLLSSRIGQGLGDFRDFGDGEVPSTVVKGPWEAIFTHNDSWGYSKFDYNFKTRADIIRLLTNIVSKGGNLMLNVGPEADGTIPEASIKTLLSVGKWLQTNGESIYGTSHGPIGAQPWGVTTLKPNKLFLHVIVAPKNREINVPEVNVKVKAVTLLSNKKPLPWKQDKQSLLVRLPNTLPDDINTVVLVEFQGRLKDSYASAPKVISSEYPECVLEAIEARPSGNTIIEPITHSYYFGDWKHTTCATKMQSPADSIVYNVQFNEPGDYKIILEYSCPLENIKQEGLLEVGGQHFYFETLATGSYDMWRPLMFIKQSVALVTIAKAGLQTIKLSPVKEGTEIFKLARVIVVPNN